MLFDPERLTAAFAGLWGGVFLGLFQLWTTFANGGPIAVADIVRAAANAVAGIMAGALFAYFTAPMILKAIPFQSLKDLETISFGIGALTWVLTPAAYKGAEAVFSSWIGKKAREAGQ